MREGKDTEKSGFSKGTKGGGGNVYNMRNITNTNYGHEG